MEVTNWFKEVPFAITVCDKEGIIIEMNEKSAVTFARDGGKELIGKSLLDCHPDEAKQQILELMKSEKVNVYTIEKNGKKKLIYQCPWYSNSICSGLVELSIELPVNLPHFVRG